MPAIPSALQEIFEEYLRNKPIPKSSRGVYINGLNSCLQGP